MPSAEKAQKKKVYFDKLISLLQRYPRVLVVVADHVGSKQMAEIRVALRGKAVLLMGKNTMMRTALKQKVATMPKAEKLMDCVKENIGMVFCIADPGDVRGIILQNKVPAPARQGVLAPIDVTVPAGPTGMDPTQTSFFQALGIATKIVKGQVEIQTDVKLISRDEKVSASAATLLQKLNVKPFSYGLKIQKVYDDGSVYNAAVLDVTPEDIIEKFRIGANYVAALSRAAGMPTPVSVPHCILEGFKNCTALVIDSDFTFPQMEKIKHFLENPGAVAAAAPAASGGGGSSSAPVAAAKEEEEEEEDEDMGFSLFD